MDPNDPWVRCNICNDPEVNQSSIASNETTESLNLGSHSWSLPIINKEQPPSWWFGVGGRRRPLNMYKPWEDKTLHQHPQWTNTTTISGFNMHAATLTQNPQLFKAYGQRETASRSRRGLKSALKYHHVLCGDYGPRTPPHSSADLINPTSTSQGSD